LQITLAKKRHDWNERDEKLGFVERLDPVDNVLANRDDVVFTLVEGDDVVPLSCGALGGLPIEMPFMDEGQASGPCCAGAHGLPKAVQASFLHVAPLRTRLYVPSSPKSLANERKRSYAPSSPRASPRRAT
jgi:hypothetical protein